MHALALGARPEASCGQGVVAPDMKYHAICPKCGYKHTAMRLPTTKDKLTQERRPYAASCGWCVKKYGRTSANFEACRLTWTETRTGQAVEWPPKQAAAATVKQLSQPAPEAEVWKVEPITFATQQRLF